MSAGAQGGGVVRVEGARQLRRTLTEAGEDLSDLKATHKRVAEIAARAGQGLAPVITGALAASVRGTGSKTAATIKAGGKRVPYAKAIHWGRMMWPSKTATPRPPRTRHEAFIYPHLFLTRGARDTEPEWVRLYLESIDDALNKIEGAHK